MGIDPVSLLLSVNRWENVKDQTYLINFSWQIEEIIAFNMRVMKYVPRTNSLSLVSRPNSLGISFSTLLLTL